jgi:dihydrodipicolinate synthase/N-acetylneuraminate lyase
MQSTHFPGHPVTGVIVPSLTLFNEQCEIDPLSNQILIKHIILNGADSLFLMGSTGEGLYFRSQMNQKKYYLQIIKELFEKNKYSLPLLIGVYGNSPEEVIEDVHLCLEIIPQAAIIIPPPTNRLIEKEEQFHFFDSIMKQIHVPIYLYNNPSNFGGTTIDVDVVFDLIKNHPHFKGIKDSSESDEQKKRYLRTLTAEFTVSCGKEGMLAQFLAMVPQTERKLVGIIPSISNLVKTCRDIVDLGIQGKDDEMIQLQNNMNVFRNKIYDGKMANGKAQRGTKLAFAYVYSKSQHTIFTSVIAPYRRDLESEELSGIKKETDSLIQKGYIKIIEN